jgi:intein-encoded DNA endonuclease-like protein
VADSSPDNLGSRKSGSGIRREKTVRRKLPPLDVRMAMYEGALALRKKSNTFKEIINQVEQHHNFRLTDKTVSDWARGVRTPTGSSRIFMPKPKAELAYVIGVVTGDASLNVKLGYQYRIRLQATDREFVEAFNQAVSKVLGRPPHRLWKGTTAKEIHVEFGSFLLHKFLLQELEQLKPFIEHDKKCVSAFLRGFFDSEGCVEKSGKLTGSNTELELLKYVQLLLSRFFGIETTGPYINTRKGSVITRRGKSFLRNSDCYYVNVRKSSLDIFYREIGLTIERKRSRLEKALGLKQMRDGERG